MLLRSECYPHDDTDLEGHEEQRIPPNEVVEACNIRIIPHTTILPPLKNEDPKCKYHGEVIEGCCFTKVFSDAQLLGNVDRRKFPDEESHIECQ